MASSVGLATLVFLGLPLVYNCGGILKMLLYTVAGLLPFLCICVLMPDIVMLNVFINAIELSKSSQAIAKVQVATKTRQALHAIKTLRLLARTQQIKSTSSISHGQLTAEDRVVLRTAFDMYDRDGSGHIDSTELIQLFTKFAPSISEEEQRATHRRIDANQDNQITFEEFCEFVAANLQEEVSEAEEVKELYAMFHPEPRGVTPDAVHKVLSDIGCEFSVNEIRELLYEVDENSDGFISEEEFAEMLEKFSSQ
eukprot:NODE_3355_length_982_cov_55.693567_g3209_i0.p1 GENE.NODE_3355_length_982_cov_55.693567_g3209_i0~~NODE_3355_length_982_cov_55.693567_g3209_i0.p1  ORF type:complete len:292 (-),score=97.56 NODE_3355_length_982_cov_55.693567_g3209_i0:106-867(-)